MPRKAKPITITLEPAERERLEELARQHCCLWGNRPSIAALMATIGRGELEVVEMKL